MSVRTAHEVGMGHAHQLDVVDVAAFACDETPIFLAHHACANTFNTHGILSLSGRINCAKVLKGADRRPILDSRKS
jgi:hypothetical protein